MKILGMNAREVPNVIRNDPGNLLLENGSDDNDVPVWSRMDRGDCVTHW